MAEPTTPRSGEPRRMTAGETEEMTQPCGGGCGADVTQQVHPAGTTFGDMQRRHWPFCPACLADRAAQEAEEAAQREAEEHERRARTVLANAGLPPLFANATFHRCRDDGMPEHAIAAAERWGRGELRGLLFSGPVGVGKSTLAAAAVRERIGVTQRTVHWTSAPQLFAALAADFDNPSKQKALGVLEGHRPLALDDFDKARPTPYGAEMMWLAVDQRVVHQAPLIVTVNSDLDALRDRWPEEYGYAIVSRLAEHCELISIDGADRRIGKVAA